MQELLGKFNKEIDEYITRNRIYTADDVKLEEDMADLVIGSYRQLSRRNARAYFHKLRYTSIESSIRLAIEFLSIYYNEEYKNEFIDALNRKFVFRTYDGSKSSYYDIDHDKIYIYLRCDIFDAITMIHEFMHYINTNRRIRTPLSMYFTEAISFHSEYSFEEFIVKYYPHRASELKAWQYNRDDCAYYNAIMFKILTGLLKVKQMGKKLNIHFLNEVINEIPGVSIDDIKVVLDAIKVELTDKDTNTFQKLYDYEMGYVIAGVFGRYLYLEQQGNKKIGVEINSLVIEKKNTYRQLFNYLGIDFILSSLDDPSLLFAPGETKRLGTICNSKIVV